MADPLWQIPVKFEIIHFYSNCWTHWLSLTSALLIPPTYQQVRQACDTIITLTANHILEKLCFRVINSSQLTQNWNDRLLGLPEEISLIRTLPKYRWLHHPRRFLQIEGFVTQQNIFAMWSSWHNPGEIKISVHRLISVIEFDNLKTLLPTIQPYLLDSIPHCG